MTSPKIFSAFFISFVGVLAPSRQGWGDQWASAPLAAAGIVSALFLVLIPVLTRAVMDSRLGRRRSRWFLRYAGPALTVLLIPALVLAGGFSTALLGVVTTLPTPGITLNGPAGVAVDTFGNVYISDGLNNGQVVEVTAAGVASVLAFPGLSPALNN